MRDVHNTTVRDQFGQNQMVVIQMNDTKQSFAVVLFFFKVYFQCVITTEPAHDFKDTSCSFPDWLILVFTQRTKLLHETFR